MRTSTSWPLVARGDSAPAPGQGQQPIALCRNRRWRAGRRLRGAGRAGALLVAVLVCLGIAGMLAGSLIYAAVALRQVVQVDLWRAQADWLAWSAVERAAATLAADAKYQGETWRVDARSLEGRYAARVDIAVESISGEPARRRIRVAVYFPDDPKHRVFRSKEVTVAVPSASGSEAASGTS